MIRPATHADIAELVGMGAALHEESSWRSMRYSPEKVAARLAQCIDSGFCAVFDRGGRPAGVIAGAVVEPWLSDELMGVEFSVYVRPECRGGRDLVRLVVAWVRWCESEGAKQIRPAISTGSLGIARVYEALGFKPQGATFMKEC